MALYSYKGPVMAFEKCIENSWTGYTNAVSERKAKSNLTYQYKKATGRLPSTKIFLPGKVEVVEE